MYPGGSGLAGPGASTSLRVVPLLWRERTRPSFGRNPSAGRGQAGQTGRPADRGGTASPSDPSSSREDVAVASHAHGGEWGDSGDCSDKSAVGALPLASGYCRPRSGFSPTRQVVDRRQ